MPMGVTAVEAVVEVTGDDHRSGSGGEDLLGGARFEAAPADARPQAGRMRAEPRHLRVHVIDGGGVPLRGPDIGEYTLTDLLGSIFDLTHRQLSGQRPA
ncbi:hypothetical protein [Streptomyces sp. bgisy027]|uniref:hypothetical protein n=1 Tax=unclassified Streptomyces TaxID=2593676 RepID=UPI003D734798